MKRPIKNSSKPKQKTDYWYRSRIAEWSAFLENIPLGVHPIPPSLTDGDIDRLINYQKKAWGSVD